MCVSYETAEQMLTLKSACLLWVDAYWCALSSGQSWCAPVSLHATRPNLSEFSKESWQATGPLWSSVPSLSWLPCLVTKATGQVLEVECIGTILFTVWSNQKWAQPVLVVLWYMTWSKSVHRVALTDPFSPNSPSSPCRSKNTSAQQTLLTNGLPKTNLTVLTLL